jgi:hypothetical protein
MFTTHFSTPDSNVGSLDRSLPNLDSGPAGEAGHLRWPPSGQAIASGGCIYLRALPPPLCGKCFEVLDWNCDFFLHFQFTSPCPRRSFCFHLHLECLPHGWPFTTHVFHVFLPFGFMLQKLLLIPSTSYVGLFREHIVLRCFIPRGRKELVHKHCQQN